MKHLMLLLKVTGLYVKDTKGQLKLIVLPVFFIIVDLSIYYCIYKSELSLTLFFKMHL